MTEHPDYYEMGIAALLPGMQHMLTLMQRSLDEMRATLAQAQNGSRPKRGRPRRNRPRRNARPPKQETARTFADQLRDSLLAEEKRRRSGWPADPEERSREMKRRQAVARQKQAKESARRKTQTAAKAFWDNLSPKDRKARLAKLQAGRRKAAAAEKKLPVARLAEAS